MYKQEKCPRNVTKTKSERDGEKGKGRDREKKAGKMKVEYFARWRSGKNVLCAFPLGIETEEGQKGGRKVEESKTKKSCEELIQIGYISMYKINLSEQTHVFTVCGQITC